jgi:hypothetical protein
MRYEDGVCATAVNQQLRRFVQLSVYDDGEILVLMADRAACKRTIHELTNVDEIPALRVNAFLEGES